MQKLIESKLCKFNLSEIKHSVRISFILLDFLAITSRLIGFMGIDVARPTAFFVINSSILGRSTFRIDLQYQIFFIRFENPFMSFEKRLTWRADISQAWHWTPISLFLAIVNDAVSSRSGKMSTDCDEWKTASEKLHFLLLSSLISRRTTQVRSIFVGTNKSHKCIRSLITLVPTLIKLAR